MASINRRRTLLLLLATSTITYLFPFNGAPPYPSVPQETLPPGARFLFWNEKQHIIRCAHGTEKLENPTPSAVSYEYLL